MSDTQSLPAVKSDTDIEQILKEIEYKFNARHTPEYKLGADDKAIEVIKTLFGDIEDFQVNIIRAAELFFELSKKILPSLKVIELRIGFDTSSCLPVALMIVEKQSAPLVDSLMGIARQLEAYIYSHDNFEVNIWTLIKNNFIEKELIRSDFPLFRTIKK